MSNSEDKFQNKNIGQSQTKVSKYDLQWFFFDKFGFKKKTEDANHAMQFKYHNPVYFCKRPR